MKFLFTIIGLFLVTFIKAQTECIEVIAVPEELKIIKEKVLKKPAVYKYTIVEGKPAVYGYRLIGGKLPVTEEVTEVIQPSYTHVYNNTQNEKCKQVVKAITSTYLKVLTEEVEPKIEKYLISEAIEPRVERRCVTEAEYEIINKVIVIKDGSIRIYNKNCE